MITCDPEMRQILRGAGNCSPSNREADMTLISKAGNACQTANVCSGKMTFESVSRPTPSGPSASAKNPPITAVGMNSARRCPDHFRISAAARNTRASRTIASPTSSAVHIRTSPYRPNNRGG
jgi:hypothetical protein